MSRPFSKIVLPHYVKPYSPVTFRNDRPRPAWAWYNFAPYSIPTDFVSRAQYSVVGTSLTPGPEYWTFSGDNNSDRINLGSIPSTHPLSLYGKDGSNTIIVDAYWDGSYPSGYPRIIDKSDGGGTSNGWAIWQDQATSQIWFQVNAPNIRVNNSSAGRFQLVIHWSGASASSEIYLIKNGVVRPKDDSSGVTTPLFSATTTNAAIGNWNHTTDRNWSGKIYGILVYHTKLPYSLAIKTALSIWSETLEPANQAKLLVSVPTGGPITLTVQDAAHAHSVDNTVLTQQSTLSVSETAHAHAADNVDLIQAYTLVPAESTHAHSADNVELVQQNTLTVAESAQAHAADNVDLVQQHVLAVAATSHAHTVDNIVLTIAGQLEVQEAAHAHTADNVDLTVAGQLSVQDAAHAHAADNIDLVQAATIVVQDTSHAHSADNIILSLSTLLSVAECTHAHSADGNLALTQANLLAIADALHAHTVDGDLGLTQAGILIVSDALHAHLADNINLILGELQTPGGTVYLVAAERRVRLLN